MARTEQSAADGKVRDAPSRRSFALSAPVIFGLHALDEYVSGFPGWATRHFGTTSKRFYVASHVVLVSAVVASAVAASRPGQRRARLLVATIAAGFVANGIFHIETTVRFPERSPGLVTALLLMIPGGVAILRDLSRGGGLDRRDFAAVALGGVLLNSAAVASLRLDMPTLQRES